MGKNHLDVGPLELEVLGLLNSSGEQSVGDIQVSLKSKGQDLAYTTVMTVLSRLYKKGLLQRRKEGRQHLYSTSAQKNNSPIKIFERVRKSLFGSERLKPILTLLDTSENLSKEELQQLKKIIDDRLKKSEK